MKLLRKTIAIIIFSFLLLLGASLSFYRFKVMGEFLKIENDIVEKDTSRLIEAIEAERHLMKVTAIDWAQWDDMYDYMKSPNKKFEESWSTYESYKALRITDTIFFNSKKKAVFGVHVNFDEEAVETAAKDSPLIEGVLSLPGIFDFSGEIPSQSIFGILNGKPVIAAASPILDSNRSKPSRGYMVIVKQIDDEFINKIAEQTRLSLASSAAADGANTAIIKMLSGDGPPVINKVDDNSIQAFTAIFDAAKSPLLVLRIDETRPVYNQGQENLRLFVGFWVIASLTAIMLAIVLLNRFIIVRLQRICSFLNDVGSQKNFSDRLDKSGNDELTKLSADINQMLTALSEAHAEVNSARQAAEEANFAKSTFIARVSHELRNPMHGIRGINHLILKRESSKAVRDLVNMGDLAAESLLSIVDEILDFSKAEAGELTFEKIAYDPRQVLRETMQVAAARLEGKYRSGETERVQFICEADPAIPRLLEGDPTRIKQILVNLLTNAVKFTERGFVGVRLEAAERAAADLQLKIKVWDTGIGIPQQKIGSLFTPFKQADETIARKYQGTGLGLSIVKQFVEGMGGAVRVTSEEGKGSCFEVTLPQRISGDPASAAELLKRSGPLPKQVVLVADPGRPAVVLAESLAALGVEPELIDPADWDEKNAARFNSADLAIVSEEALYTRSVAEAFSARIRNAAGGRTLALLKPSSLDLRERLYSLGMKSIFTMPVLADDLLFAFNAAPVESAEHEVAKAIESVRKLRVIIADDAPTNRIILQEMLEDCGHEVVPVSDGKEIIGLVEPMLSGQAGADQFDLIITDVSMSIMNGDEAAQIIRKLESKIPNGGHLPIIAVTGQAFEGEREQMRSAGIDGILTKPMHPRQLEAELERLFGAK